MARTKAFDKEVVLRKATSLFWDRGYHDTSMQDLVDHLGINRSSIYDTFGDKHGLFLASLNHYHKSYQLDIREFMGQKLDLNRFLSSFLKDLIDDCMEDQEKKGCFIVNCSVELSSHDDQVNKIVTASRDVFIKNFTLFFQDQMVQGSLPEQKNAEALSNFFYSSVISIKLLSRTSSKRKMLEDIASMTVEAIVR